MNTTRMPYPMTDETEFATGRWEPCPAFAPEVPDSQVCGDCGWLHDDHHADAVIRHLPARVPMSVEPRRLAS